jgi:hypothetical protein
MGDPASTGQATRELQNCVVVGEKRVLLPDDERKAARMVEDAAWCRPVLEIAG